MVRRFFIERLVRSEIGRIEQLQVEGMIEPECD